MLFLLVPAAVLVLVLGIPAMLLLRRRGVRNGARMLLALALAALGAVPVSWLAFVSYIRATDYVWAIHGPYPFSHIGGGPFMGALVLASVVLSVACFIAALLVAGRPT